MAFHLLPTRRQTFTKTARKGLAKALLWPHPLRSKYPHPDALAASGFYHVAGTTTRCFACQLEVSDWAEGDDVHSRHGEHCPSSVFARLKDSWAAGVGDKKSWSWGDNGREWPRARWLMQLRLQSFSIGWPRAGEKGVPSTNEIAQAGWFFRPGSEGGGDDCVMCPYCTRTVEGWEAGDVPHDLHKRKAGLKCPFFLAPQPADYPAHDEPGTPAPDTPGIRMVTNNNSAAESSDESAAERAAAVAAAKKKGKQVARSRSKPNVDEPEVEVEVEQEQTHTAQPQPSAQRATRRGTTLSAIAAAPSSDVGSVFDVAPTKTRASRTTKKADPTPSEPATATRSRAESVTIVDTPSSSLGQPPALAPVAKTRSRAGSVSIADTPSSSLGGPPAKTRSRAGSVSIDTPTAASVVAPSLSKSRSRASKLVVEQVDSEAVTDEVPAKPKGVRNKKAAVPPVVEEPEDEVEMADVESEPEPAPALAAPKKKSSKKAKKVDSSRPTTADSPRTPLSPRVASPSPRPIRSLPSKVHSRSPKSPAAAPRSPPSPLEPLPPPSVFASYVAPPNPFGQGRVPEPTQEEMEMTVGEWYALVARRTLDKAEREMGTESDRLEKRFEMGWEVLLGMRDDARKVAEREAGHAVDWDA